MERYGPYYLYVHIMCYSYVGINGEQGSPLHITVEATHKVQAMDGRELVFGYGCPFQVARRPVVWPFWHARIPYFARIKRTYVSRYLRASKT